MELLNAPQYSSYVNSFSMLNNSHRAPIPINSNPKTEEKNIPLGFTYAPPNQKNPLRLILLILLVSPYIKRDKARTVSRNKAEDNFDDWDTILDILSSIYPYLDSEYQDGINFIFGLTEAKSLLESLLRGSYYKFSKSDTSMQTSGYQERAIGIIRSIQPYISVENQILLNRILNTIDSLEVLAYRLNRFKQRSLEVQNSNKNSLAKVIDLIDIIKILIPGERQQHFNQISNILKLMETIDLAQGINSSENDNSSITAENKITSNADIDADTAPENYEEDNKAINIDAISHSLKSVLKPEQAKSLDLIMKMAQLLSLDSEEKESAD